jgi:uncharacterized protein (TIGR02217 family)
MFIDDTIDQCAAYGFTGGPTFRTNIAEMRSWREKRNADVDMARHEYSAPYNNISQEGWREIRRMFYVCRGKLHSFRLRDPNDYQAANELFGIGDGVSTIFQLSNLSEADGVTYSRLVQLPVNPTIYVDGVEVAASVDLVTGEVDFGSSVPLLGEALTWSGTFDIKVRFDQDSLPFSLDSRRSDGFAINGSVNLIEDFGE